MKKIGFIGVGVMGKGMVKNLADANYDVTIYTRTKSKVTDLLNEKIIWCNSIKECIQDCDIIMTMVGFPKDVEDVYFGKDGIIENVKAGTILIDFTTSNPDLSKKIYQQCKEKNINSLDAPVSGGDIGAQNGTLSIMVGGDKDCFEQVLPVLNVLGTNINYTGVAGSGQHTKMANQIAIAGTLAGVCEAIYYSQKTGLDPNLMLTCISSGAAGSWQMSNNGAKILNNDLQPAFYIKHFIKDMKIAQNIAKTYNFDLNVLNEVLAMFIELQEQGYEDLGTQALIKYYQR